MKHFKKSINFSIFDLAHCETTQRRISSTHTYVKAPSIIFFYFRSCKIYVQIREVPIFQPFCFFPQKSHYYAYSMEITVIFPQCRLWVQKLVYYYIVASQAMKRNWDFNFSKNFQLAGNLNLLAFSKQQQLHFAELSSLSQFT